MKTFKKLCLLFWDFFKIGLFTFGGGYAMISLINNTCVEKRKYLSSEEFSDLIAIAESTPGPIAINSATYIGFKVFGVLGAILSSIAVALPSFIIILLISFFLPTVLDIPIIQKAFIGIQCAVVVLIISASFKLFKNVKKNWFSYVLMLLSGILLLLVNYFSWDISTIYFILAGAIFGFIYYYPKIVKQDKLFALSKEVDDTKDSNSENLENQTKKEETQISEEKINESSTTSLKNKGGKEDEHLS